MALRNRINWAIAEAADTPVLFMLSPYGVLQPVDSRGIDMGDGSLLNPKMLNGRAATYRKMTDNPGYLLGCGPNDGDTDIDLYPPITVVRGLFGAGPDTVCEGDDYRLSDARYPVLHAESHYITGTDHIIPNMIGAVDLTDERLTDKREPRLHAETHSALGEDRITPFQIGAAPIDHRYPIATNEIRGHVQPDGFTIKVSPQGVIKADPQHIDAAKIDSGTIDIARLPKGAIGDIKVVLNDEKRFELTIKEVQNGDTVKVNSTKVMYFVVDDTKLDSEDGYMEYTAYESAFVDWDGVKNKPFEFAPTDHAYNHSTSGTDVITPVSIGAADRVHGHTVDEVTGAVADTDPRLTDDRKPLQHNHTVDEVIGAALEKHTHTAEDLTGVALEEHTHVLSEVTGVVADDDPRLTDARTPTAHAASHAAGGSDEITLASIGAAADTHDHPVVYMTKADAANGAAVSSKKVCCLIDGDTIQSVNNVLSVNPAKLTPGTHKHVYADLTGVAASSHAHSDYATFEDIKRGFSTSAYYSSASYHMLGALPATKFSSPTVSEIVPFDMKTRFSIIQNPKLYDRYTIFYDDAGCACLRVTKSGLFKITYYLFVPERVQLYYNGKEIKPEEAVDRYARGWGQRFTVINRLFTSLNYYTCVQVEYILNGYLVSGKDYSDTSLELFDDSNRNNFTYNVPIHGNGSNVNMGCLVSVERLGDK